jgi:hypothetical protein
MGITGLETARIARGLAFPVRPIPCLIAMKLMAGGRKEELDILDIQTRTGRNQNRKS